MIFDLFLSFPQFSIKKLAIRNVISNFASMNNENNELTLEVMICTFGPSGGRKVADMLLPPMKQVRYLVAWQGDCDKPIPAELQSRPDTKVMLLPGKGLSRNRNFALDNASGDLLMVADDDLQLHPEGLLKVIDTFRRDPQLVYGSFMYDNGEFTKRYPKVAVSLHRLPKDFYQTSFEIVLRRDSAAGCLRFNEEFGIGAPLFGCGEEELLLKRARNAGLVCRFFPILIATHTGPTTGVAPALSDSVLRARGVLTSTEYPLTAPLRLLLNSWRIARAGQAPFFRAFRHQWEGAIYGWFSNELHSYLTAMTSTDAPLLTVIIPVFNRESLVKRTLDSVAAQTLRPLRVVLVDNNSTDGTMETLRRWKEEVEAPDFQVTILQEPTPGAAAARNCGLEAANTPYTLFFDSDDRMATNHCQRALNGFVENPDADIVGWDVLYAFPNKSILKPFADRDFHWNNLHFGSMATQRYAARTSLFREVGGWNPSCLGWDDTELGCRLLLAARKVVKLEGVPTVSVIPTVESITGSSFSSGAGKWENTLDIVETTFAKAEGLSSRRRLKLQRIVRLRRAILAGDYSHEAIRPDLGPALMRSVIAGESSVRYRLIYRLAYLWRKSGFRGAARLLRPFFLDNRL